MENLTIKDILNKYPFTHSFYVSYALDCAKYANSKVKPLPEALKAIEIVELYLLGKATKEECKVAADAAYTAYTAVYTVYTAANADAAYTAANAANAAANAAADAAYYAYTAATAAAAATAADITASYAATYDELKKILIKKIKNLGEFELEFLGLEI